MENTFNTTTARTFSAVADDLIDGGEYEVTLENAEPVLTNAGTKQLRLKFRIRKDVDQQFGNRVVFDKLWEDKDVDNWGGWFDHKKLQKLILTQEKPELTFQDCDACIQYLNGLNMRITIEKKHDDYYGKEINSVKSFSYTKSKVVAPASSTVAPTLEMPKEDDLPF